jgi:quercetin dioxygenase-like cupin family protein
MASNKEESSTPASLPGPRLVSTAHTSDGTSVFASDQTIQPFQPFGPSTSAFHNFDIWPTLPANNTEAVSPSTFANTFPRCAPGGAYFGLTDIPPNYSAPMHRTVSLDYAVVLSGEIVCVLDGGEEKTIAQGEFIIQRGTNHQWINRSKTEVARILFVMVGAEKVVLEDGKELEETVFKR